MHSSGNESADRAHVLHQPRILGMRFVYFVAGSPSGEEVHDFFEAATTELLGGHLCTPTTPLEPQLRM